jgi:hypothetical protein
LWFIAILISLKFEMGGKEGRAFGLIFSIVKATTETQVFPSKRSISSSFGINFFNSG